MFYGKRKSYHKTYKRKNYKNKKNKSVKKPMSKPIDERTEMINAIDDFQYATDFDQFFDSEKERQKHLDEKIKLLKESVDKYIQKRSEAIKDSFISSS